MKAYRVNKFRSPAKTEKYQTKTSLLRWYFYRRLDVALKLGDISEDSTILDLGTGRGFFIPSLALASKYAIACNIYVDEIKPEDTLYHAWAWGKTQLEWARELVKVELGSHDAFEKVAFCYANGAYLPLKDSSVNVVFALDCLEHMSYPTKALCLAEMRRVLRKGGHLICTLPIEKGLVLLLRNLLGRIAGFQRQQIGFREAIKAAILNRPVGEWVEGHIGYDYSKDLNLIRANFHQVRVSYIPIPFLFNANPTIAIKAVKES